MPPLTDIFQHIRTSHDPNTTFHTGGKNLDNMMGDGLQRKRVVEVSGPPGSGKTTIGLSACLDALKRGHRVLWLSTTNHPLPITRMSQMDGFDQDLLSFMFHIRVNTTAQFISLIQNQNIPQDISMIIIDGVSSLIEQVIHSSPARGKIPTIQNIFSLLIRLADNKNIAVLMLNDMKVVSSRYNQSPHLIPSLEYGIWDKKFNSLTRLVLYRQVREQIFLGEDGEEEDAYNSSGDMHLVKLIGDSNQDFVQGMFYLSHTGISDVTTYHQSAENKRKWLAEHNTIKKLKQHNTPYASPTSSPVSSTSHDTTMTFFEHEQNYNNPVIITDSEDEFYNDELPLTGAIL